MYKDVVITGIGIVSPFGIGENNFWQNFISCCYQEKRGILKGNLKENDTLEIRDFDASAYIKDQGLKYYSKSARFALVASKLALDKANFSIDFYNSDEMGIIFGSVFGNMQSVYQFYSDALTNGLRYVNPMIFPNTMDITIPSQVAINFGIKGINRILSNGSTSGMDALCYACDLLKSDELKFIAAGGGEELCSFMYLEPSDSKGNTNPLIFGEGCSILALEQLDSAIKRGAEIYARIAGYGQSFAPSGTELEDKRRSAIRSIETALNESDISIDNIDYICSSGEFGSNSFIENEVLNFLLDKNPKIKVSLLKHITGECFAFSNALQVSIGALAIKNKMLPPNVILDEVNKNSLDDTKCIVNVLCTSFSEMGNYTSIVLQAVC